MTSDQHSHAREYAGRGWPVFPCRPRGKEPIVEHGCNDATTDRELIDAWWTVTPDANVAVRTGVAFDVLDLDGPEAVEKFRPWCEEHGIDPYSLRTMVSKTARGWHYLFSPTGLGNRAKLLGAPIDWRGAGGYVITPPSVHPTGHVYTWAVFLQGVPLPEAPPALLDLLDPPRPAAFQPSLMPTTLRDGDAAPYAAAAAREEFALMASAGEGARNDTLFRCACKLLPLVNGGHLHPSVIDDLAVAARGTGLTDREIDRTLLSARRVTIDEVREVPAARPGGPAQSPSDRPAEPYPPPVAAPQVAPPAAAGPQTSTAPGARLTRLSDVQRENISWLWRDHLPLRKVVDLSGDPGLGKSTLALDIAARLSTGAPMPDGTGGSRPRGTLILSAEDGLADTIRPRLEAAGADLDRVVAMTGVGDGGPTSAVVVHRAHAAIHAAEGGLTRQEVNAVVGGMLTAPQLDTLLETVPGLEVVRHRDVTRYVTHVKPPELDASIAERLVILPRDLPLIELAVREHDIALVIVDVLVAYIDGKINTFRDQDVRQVLARLAAVAERTGSCILFLRHLNKSGGRSAVYRGGGSIGIIGAARAGFIVGIDPDDEDVRVLACSKMNLGPEPPSLRYVLEADPATGMARVSWQGESPHRASDLLGEPGDDTERTERSEAAAWLLAFLTEERQGGEASYADIRKAARADGIAERTLQRARSAAGVVTHRQGFPCRTVWRVTK